MRSDLALVNPKLEKWYPPLERMGFIANRAVCIDAVEMWLMGCAEKSVVAVLACSEEQWENWKRDESFNYLVACLTDPVRGLVHGRFTRLTAKALDRIEQVLDAGNLRARELAALTAVLVDKQIEIEKRMGRSEDEVPEEVKQLWENLKRVGKVRVKEIEGEVIDAGD